MYKGVLQNLFTGPNTSVKYFDAFVLALKYDKSSTAFFRLANTAGTKGLRTCSVKLCEKSEEVSPPTNNKSAVDVKRKQDKVKSGKEGLLDLLGAMKVEVTNKKKNQKKTQLFYTTKERKSSLESTISMFEKATVISSPQSEILAPELVAAASAAASTLPDPSQAESERLQQLQQHETITETQKKGDGNNIGEILAPEIVAAASAAASTLPDPSLAESELLQQLQQHETITETQKKGDGNNIGEILAPEIVAAASAAASTLPDPSLAESELLQQLRQHETITETQKKGDGNNIGVLLAEMKIGRNPNRLNAHRQTHQIRFDDDGQGFTHERSITGELGSDRIRRNLFTAKRLNIFSASEVTGEPTDERPTLWDIDFVNQLSTVTNQLPRNGFEEMIQWTQQGKLWQYPIDNEAGLEEEASVPFHEHIFLEKHLEEGFPRQGPIRHFMELVVAGLSKNPHLTVQQKKDHIFWFRGYFCQKEEVLKEDDVYLN